MLTRFLKAYFFVFLTENTSALEFRETTDQIEDGLESCTGNLTARIAGGEPANQGSWPWLVRLTIDDTMRGSLTCGGTIVSRKYVLTAAHCLYFATNVVAIFADGSIARNESDEFTLESTTFHIHPDYVGQNRDMGLIEFDDIYSNERTPGSIQSVCFSSVYTTGVEACWTAGWGELSYGGRTPDELHSVGLNIFSKYYCYRYSFPMPFFEDDICAGSPDKDGNGLVDAGRDTCQGDSGGPLICNVEGRATMIGLTSRGVGCAFEGYPGLYTSILDNSDWLNSMLGNSSFRGAATDSSSICDTGKTLDFFGNCVNESANLKIWTASWTSCANEIRSRKYRFSSAIPQSSWIAPHFKIRNEGSRTVTEACNDPSISCVENNAEYSSSTGTCEPISGFKRTEIGILPLTVEEIGDEIIAEVGRRTGALFGLISRFDFGKFSRLTRMLEDAEEDMMKKVTRNCGRISQRLNPRIYEEIISIHNELETIIKPTSSDTDGLRRAIKLLNRYQQNTIFNCPRSGYGPDPTDKDDSGGVTCVPGKARDGGNMNYYHKCKVTLRMKNVFEATLLVRF